MNRACFAHFPTLLLLTAALPVRAQRRAPADPTADQTLLATVLSMESEQRPQGARIGELEVVNVSAMRAVRKQVALSSDECVRAVAVGANGIEVDLALSVNRVVVARDTSVGSRASLEHCAAPSRRAAQLEILVPRGTSRVALGLYRVARANAESVPVNDSSGATAEAGSIDDVNQRAAQHAPSFEPVSAAVREELRRGQRIERDLSITPGRCYRLIASGAPSTIDIEMSVKLSLSGAGGSPQASATELDRDGSQGPSSSVGVLRPFCPVAAGTYRAVFSLAGEGAFSWQLLGAARRSTNVAVTTVTQHEVGGADFVGSRVRAEHARRYSSARALLSLHRGTLETSGTTEITFEAEAGNCYGVVGAGVPSVRELHLRVLDGLGNELARDATHGSTPTAVICPAVAGRMRAEVRAFHGYGPVGLQAFGPVPRMP